MKQYFRYCAWLCYGDVPYCTAKKMVKTDASIRTANLCPEFALSDLGDVETGRMYQPRKERREDGKFQQIRMVL